MLNRTAKHFIALGKERGVDLEVHQGTRHLKLFYGPHLILVISSGLGPKGDPRAMKNKMRDFKANLQKAMEYEQARSTGRSR
jgi:hypothetical protein